MPIIRYFAFAGSLLVALLFLTDYLFPAPLDGRVDVDVDRSIIRIHTARTLPERIVFDTSTLLAPSREASIRDAKNEIDEQFSWQRHGIRAIAADRTAYLASIADQKRSRRPVGIAQLALEDLSRCLAGQRIQELDLLRHLEVGQPLAQKGLHRRGGELRARLPLDAGA